MDKALIKEKIKNHSVMFVDDEEVITEIMKNILPRLFKEVHYATNGVEGIYTYNNSPTDLVISDISMPQLDGIQMMENIKETNSEVKYILLSGHNEAEYLKNAQTSNCEYIIKPVNSELLYKALDKLF